MSDINREIANWMADCPRVLWGVSNPVEDSCCFTSFSKKEVEEWFNIHLLAHPNSPFKDYVVRSFELFPEYLGNIATDNAPLRFVTWAMAQLQFCKVLAPSKEDPDKDWIVETVDGSHPFNVMGKGENLPIALYQAMRNFLRFKEEGPAYL